MITNQIRFRSTTSPADVLLTATDLFTIELTR